MKMVSGSSGEMLVIIMYYANVYMYLQFMQECNLYT